MLTLPYPNRHSSCPWMPTAWPASRSAWPPACCSRRPSDQVTLCRAWVSVRVGEKAMRLRPLAGAGAAARGAGGALNGVCKLHISRAMHCRGRGLVILTGASCNRHISSRSGAGVSYAALATRLKELRQCSSFARLQNVQQTCQFVCLQQLLRSACCSFLSHVIVYAYQQEVRTAHAIM